MSWENNKRARMTRLYTEKDETKMVFGGKYTVVDPLTCKALALASGSIAMSWHDDRRLSFLLLAAVVRGEG
jgi:hypothetical protein